MEKERPEAYLGISERDTTERILDRMTDPELIEQKEWKKKEARRVEVVKSRYGL